ncbi:MAG: thiamine pyrophosphate-dependent dehydrogenase E1 component subunit alpha [Fimbriimonadaceae bacterium]|jgi:pyruvate dehydrogenase E1 component alpha subunit|nr:thiamine pyrophosphate-dependent dehydrogenase E1 component subunit alpha [Fimbriimonadaceae bacterium]
MESPSAESFLRQMATLQALERELTTLSQSGRLRGSLHLAQGQEAVPAGACAALQPSDYLTATYRGHGYVLAKGCSLDGVLAEILGKATGLACGKGGKMHLFDLSHGLLGTNGIVGAGVGSVVGAALTAKMDRNGRVGLTVFGDGAINQGHVHEAMNMAALYQLPVIFLCENNLYAEMTPLHRSHGNVNLLERASSYGMDAIQVDGNDPFKVYEVVKKAVDLGRSGGGPTFIEALTYRTVGHYQADAGTSYRTLEEIEEWRQNSPIKRLSARIGPDAEKIIDEADELVHEAVERALGSPDPDPATALQGVFA